MSAAGELLNRERALDLMSGHGIDALVATTIENITYLTGHVGRRVPDLGSTYGLFAAHSQPRVELIVGGIDVAYHVSRPGHADVIRPWGSVTGVVIQPDYAPHDDEMRRFLAFATQTGASSAFDALVEGLVANDLSRGRVAIDQPAGSLMLGALRDRLPECDLVPTVNLFLLIRLVKTPAELECLRRAATINEDAVTTMVRALRPGVSEIEAAALWRSEIDRAGAIPDWCYVAGGERSAWFFPPTSRRLRDGDLFIYDCGLFYDNYNADTGCCGSIGEPAALDRRRFDAVQAGLEAAIDIVAEGVVGSAIYETMVAVARETGWPEFDSGFAGHPLGLDRRELPSVLGPRIPYVDPFLPESSDFPLPANAVLNVEAPMGIVGHGGFQLERTVVVTPGGHVDLVPQERAFTVVR